jgi:hypothetical protein
LTSKASAGPVFFPINYPARCAASAGDYSAAESTGWNGQHGGIFSLYRTGRNRIQNKLKQTIGSLAEVAGTRDQAREPRPESLIEAERCGSVQSATESGSLNRYSTGLSGMVFPDV